ncbi:MAG: ABC transporter permease [Planctomycetales bacterium]|nr:ABC transporter permease [Planctomycetales bacterium]
MAPPTTETQHRRQYLSVLTRLGPSLGLIAVWTLFALLKGGSFANWNNQRLMLLQTTVVATAATGATLVIASGGIDLSVGSAIAMGTMIIAFLLKQGVAPGPAAILAIAAGGGVGLVIGTMIIGRIGRVVGAIVGAGIGYACWQPAGPWVAFAVGSSTALILAYLVDRLLGKIELSPFIVTLAMWGGLRGIAKGIGNNQPIYPDQTWLTDLMQPSSRWLSLAPGVLIAIVLTIVMSLILRYTRFGRYIYGIGSNEQTARLCGVHVERTKLLIYGLASMCTAIAALLQFSFLYGQGDPTTADGYELKVIASVVIGGASLTGGEGTILGTVFGALIMTVVDNGCTKLGLNNWVQEIVTGAIILAAVSLDQLRHRRSE